MPTLRAQFWSGRGLAGRGLRVLAVLLAIAGLVVTWLAPDAKRRLMLASASCLALLLLVALPFSTRRKRLVTSLEVAFDAQLGVPLFVAISGATASVLLAWALLYLRRGGFDLAATAACWTLLSVSLAELLSETATRSTVASAQTTLMALERPTSDRVPQVDEVVSLHRGDRVFEDLVLLEGTVRVSQFGLAALSAERGPGRPVAAGSVVEGGEATARVVAVGRQRAFVKLLADVLERVDHAAPAVRSLQRLAPLGAATVVAVALALGLAGRGSFASTVVAALAAGVAVLTAPARRLAVRDQLRGVLAACEHGVAFADAYAFNEAGVVRSAVLCTESTVLSQTHDSMEIEAFSGLSMSDVVALAAGLFASHAGSATLGAPKSAGLPPDPYAAAILQQARQRMVRPANARAVTYQRGLGLVGELGTGARVVVGSRALCLEQGVATAEVELRMEELEQAGRDVLLVAREGRLVGLLSFHVPLRRGARAAVQHLHDLDIDPILLSSMSRERLLSIGRALDTPHVRPEVLPDECDEEVQRLVLSAGPLVVVGDVLRDSECLRASGLSFGLNDAGAQEALAIAACHARLDLVVQVLSIAQATRARVAATLWVGLTPAALMALPVALGLVRSSYAPFSALAAILALAVRDVVSAALPEGEGQPSSGGASEAS